MKMILIPNVLILPDQKYPRGQKFPKNPYFILIVEAQASFLKNCAWEFPISIPFRFY